MNTVCKNYCKYPHEKILCSTMDVVMKFERRAQY